MTDEIAVADIGGTHARFAIAEVDGGRVAALGEPITLKTAEYASLQTAWEAFGARLERPLPRAAGIAVAGPIAGAALKLTNNPWIIRPALIREKLGVERYTLVNDFGAVGYALLHIGDADLAWLCGPEGPLPAEGVTSVVGPGTGLGVAMVMRRGGHAHVVETEGGHADFAPLDSLEDAILARLRKHYRRVSVERVVSGPALADIYEALAAIEGRAVQAQDDKSLWTAAMDGGDSLAAAALDRFCMSLGAVAGDVALVHGADAVVIAGGLGLRLAKILPRSGFGHRFTAKGRFEGRMAAIPVRVLTHPQPGLLGAAAAFLAEHGGTAREVA
jgi:glucokinase